MTIKKQILKFNIVMFVLFTLFLTYILMLVWGKQIWNFIFFIRFDYWNAFAGDGPWVFNYPLFILIADLIGNIYLWSRLPSKNKGLPTDDLRL
jgi:hypothetical protein